jgi:hypothetical protein
MKIKLKTKIEKEITVDVEFPLYVEHDCSGDGYESIRYIKRESETMHINLHKSHSYISGDTTYELEISKRKVNDTADYFLGQGEYKSSKEEFEEMLKEFKEKLNSI